MSRVRIKIEYDGKNFSGFQLQPNKRTVQGEIERVLEFLFKKKIRIFASGRTDAGVSAFGQIAHFDIDEDVVEKKLFSSLNALLPEDISINELSKTSDDFDARFSAKKKTYAYLFYVSRHERPLFRDRAVRINDYADISLMREGCKFLIGTFDFKSFVSKKSGKTDFVRTIFDAKIVELGQGLFAFEITGNGFLYNMVRIIFGTLVQVAYKKIKPSEVHSIILSQNRSKAGRTMPPYALFLKNVEYF